MTADETLNELLVCLFKDLTEIEGRCLITDEFSDISINDMHIIEAIGVDEPKRSGTVAKLMSITLGTLTKAIDGLTRKGYVNRIRSEEDKRVVKLSLTDKGKSAYYHHEQFHRHMIEHIKDDLSDDEMKVLITSLAEENLPDFICSEIKFSKYSPNNMEVFFAIALNFIQIYQ